MVAQVLPHSQSLPKLLAPSLPQSSHPRLFPRVHQASTAVRLPSTARQTMMLARPYKIQCDPISSIYPLPQSKAASPLSPQPIATHTRQSQLVISSFSAMPSRTESPDLSRPFTGGDIVDIGGGQVASLIYAQLQDCFVRAKAQGERPSLPEEPLYDDEGLRIWSKVIYHPQYYQTQDEIDLLVQNGKEIASYIQPGTKLIDLGAGYVDSTCFRHIWQPC
jgi:hypothetical protein